MQESFRKLKVTRKNVSESFTDRQERIPGWRQDRMKAGRALILGAGALGNEVTKNLALMGLGYMLIADFDRVDRSNLSRTVMFRKNDVRTKSSKASILARRVKRINVLSNSHAQPFHGDVVWRLGTGVFRRIDVAIGCLDNVEARVATNKQCILTNTPLIDGGIYGLSGNVVSINPPHTACWECTISPAQILLANERYDSCSRVMRSEWASGRVPTVQVASSIVAGFQTEEAVKIIQGQPWASGTKLLYSAVGARPNLDIVNIARRPDCWCHEYHDFFTPIETNLSATENTLQDLLTKLDLMGYSDAEIRFPDSLVLARHCHQCGNIDPILRPAFELNTEILVCPSCRASSDQVELIHAESLESAQLLESEIPRIEQRIYSMKLYDLGFPMLGWIQFQSHTETSSKLAIELTGDAPRVMGGVEYVDVRR